jgi:hypothetical protein
MSTASGGFLDPYRSTIINVAVKELMIILVTKLPFLSFGPLGAVASWILGWVLGIALDKTVLGVNMAIIEISTDLEVAHLKKALDEAKTIDPKDLEKKEANEKDIIEAARKLITLRTKPTV